MRNSSSSTTGLIGVGILLIVLGAINHFVVKANPVAHTSTILGIVGLLAAIAGGAMMMRGSNKA
ncbi:MAG: hypothetical protein IVW57_03815 [Ktedonobacterales bacterium]|nr:hypothetical protein [Ktedonobacterales bacterium]